ncbi:MAG: hypothetical protein D9V47_04040 [Clostridia bacterium]|nr:MAG: hypothetical protein D9V47_04040 [Clostridia bacterium]
MPVVNLALVDFMRSVKPFIGRRGGQMVETAEALVNLVSSEGGSLVHEKFSSLLVGGGAASMAATSNNIQGNPYTLFLILFLLILSSSFDRQHEEGQISGVGVVPVATGPAEEEDEE